MNGVGSLTYDEAMALQEQGLDRHAIASRAGVHASSITRWRAKHGLARQYSRFPVGEVDRRTYQREWSRQRRRRQAGAA